MCIFYVSSINLSFQPHRKRQFYDLETLYDSKIVFNNPFRAQKHLKYLYLQPFRGLLDKFSSRT